MMNPYFGYSSQIASRAQCNKQRSLCRVKQALSKAVAAVKSTALRDFLSVVAYKCLEKSFKREKRRPKQDETGESQKGVRYKKILVFKH